MGAVAWGEQTVPSGIAALLIALMPAWVAIFSRVFVHERLPLAATLGIGVGMAGVAILVGPSIAIDGSLDPAGIVALLISPICWAAGSVFAAHRARLPEDPFVATGFQMLSGAAVLGALAIATGEIFTFRLDQITQEALVALAYLTLVGSLVAFTAYVWVLRHAPLPLIATYAFVNPVVAVILGAIVLNETVTPLQVVAGCGDRRRGGPDHRVAQPDERRARRVVAGAGPGPRRRRGADRGLTARLRSRRGSSARPAGPAP